MEQPVYTKFSIIIDPCIIWKKTNARKLKLNPFFAMDESYKKNLKELL